MELRNEASSLPLVAPVVEIDSLKVDEKLIDTTSSTTPRAEPDDFDIPDIPDEEDDLDQFLADFEDVCEEFKLTPEQAYAMYAERVDPLGYAKVKSFIYQQILTLGEDKIKELAGIVHSQESIRRESYKTDLTGKKMLIKLHKELTQKERESFIIDINKDIQRLKPVDVILATSDWDNNTNIDLDMIKSSKNTFKKFIDAGLLGVLATNKYYDSARKLFCMAYMQATTSGDNIIFNGVDQNLYKEKFRSSITTMVRLLEQK
jgi:hypothetical protein